MIEFSHELDLIYQRLLSILFTVSSFFRKGFYGILLSILMFINKINRCKIAFAYLLNWLKKLVKSSLIDFLRQSISPMYPTFLIGLVLQDNAFLLSFKANSKWPSQFFIL
jgi:hypothetical protein